MLDRNDYHDDSGYATIVVTGLMSLMSLLVILLVQNSLANAQKTSRLVKQIEHDFALETAVNNVIHDIVEARTIVPIEGTNLTEIIDETRIAVSVSHLSHKLSLSNSSAEETQARATNLPIPENARGQFLNWVSNHSDGNIPVSLREFDLLLQDFTLNERNCIRENFTVFNVSAGGPARQNSSRVNTDGTTLIIQARILDAAPVRSLSVTGIITGRRDDPFFVLDWNRSSESLACQRERS